MILVAPPGAGKTTTVPLYLANEAFAHEAGGRAKRILVLVPRRLAARGAAERMAHLLGEKVGETVGYRVRFDSRISPKTRIELITEGVFTRLIADDPMLEGVAAVVFDEYHERSLEADLGLALALESQEALVPDLRVLVMSATLDIAALKAVLGDAPVIETRGRAFPVETHYRERQGHSPLEPHVLRTTNEALKANGGNALVFLPGRRDVDRFVDLLRSNDGPAAAAEVAALHGGLDGQAQAALLRPPQTGRRRITVATSIAQSSLTLPGITLVIDAGLARRPLFDPATGLTRLETVRVSRASADQRRGRAGRTAPGVCYRLWGERQTNALEPHDTPEILDADLAPLTLTLARIGIRDAASLSWIDEPPKPALEAALQLLTTLSLIDEEGLISPQGRAAERLPVHPRLAHMIGAATRFGLETTAAEMAALLSEPTLGGSDLDLAHRLSAFQKATSGRAKAARAQAAKWAKAARAHRRDDTKSVFLAHGASDTPAPGNSTLGALAALAFPDRIAQQRPPTAPQTSRDTRLLLSGGSGAVLEASHPLAREAMLVALEVTGSTGKEADGRIRLAAALDEHSLPEVCAHLTRQERQTAISPSSGRVEAWQIERLGALVLSKQKKPLCAGEAEAVLLANLRADGLDGLGWDMSPNSVHRRLAFLHRKLGEPWPNMSPNALLDELDTWLAPFLWGLTRLSDVPAKTLDDALLARLTEVAHRDLDRLAPAIYQAPSGRKLVIDYGAEAGPTVACRVQDLFGLRQHPAVLAGTEPLVFTLLSPANRPFQTTSDIVRFWRGSWRDARKEMKSRYPKHAWPEDPEAAIAQLRSRKS